jgi:L-aspartate oxidase
MEFVQFHPTALYVKKAPRFLLSEALRGEGAYLRNAEMQRFMPKYHDMAELAPRDVVARAIAHELEVSRLADPVVYLDLTHLDPSHLAARFPRIHSTCLQYNIDIGTDLIPVRPAAHYAMGGVRTDLHGRTSLPGLYAAGEAACTGVHGANRLASNSLLEGLVYGARAGATMREDAPPPRANAHAKTCKSVSGGSAVPDARGSEEIIRAVRDLAWKNIGIVRSGSGLREAIEQLEKWRHCLPPMNGRRQCEANNIFQTALLIARSALARQDSRGAHYRLDYPSHNDARFKKHSVVRGDSVRFE